LILVVASIFLTYGGYGRISFGADQSIVPNEETARRLTNEFWDEVDRLGLMPAMGRGNLMMEQAV
jgi:hypothetical protein